MTRGEQEGAMPKGPCVSCGAINYELSMGGSGICPSCDCGIDPKVTKLQAENTTLKAELEQAKQREARLREALSCIAKIDQGELRGAISKNDTLRMIEALTKLFNQCREAAEAALKEE